ncbi:MAG: fumarylacetoacetate hydrolase family protein [Pseudomonadota bacterium]
MRLRRRDIGGTPIAEMQVDGTWKRLTGVGSVADILAASGHMGHIDDLLPYLQLGQESKRALSDLGPTLPEAQGARGIDLVPVVPRSFRDFMLYEQHVITASRGMARRFLPRAFAITQAYEALLRRPFPKFRPHRLWYQQPIYYLSNHINIATEGAPMPWPGYCEVLDYELEIGAVLARPLRNATPAQARDAIGGFVVLNDFSARDVQIDEMRSGFGPQKSKHFGSAISAEIVSADELLPHLDTLNGTVAINGETVAHVNSGGAQFSLVDAIAFASRSETLVPGELFGSGTLPGGAGIETGALVAPGDTLTLTVDRLGQLTNPVAPREGDNAHH